VTTVCCNPDGLLTTHRGDALQDASSEIERLVGEVLSSDDVSEMVNKVLAGDHALFWCKKLTRMTVQDPAARQMCHAMLLGKGVEHFQAGQHGEAKAVLSAALTYADDMKYAATARVLAQAYMGLAEPAMALDCLQLADSRQPDSAASQLLRVLVSEPSC
jgi:tetratricopeptide (TPR) repeat protein